MFSAVAKQSRGMSASILKSSGCKKMKEKTFEEKFPSFVGRFCDCIQCKKIKQSIEKNCLDKQRVREVITRQC